MVFFLLYLPSSFFIYVLFLFSFLFLSFLIQFHFSILFLNLPSLLSSLLNTLLALFLVFSLFFSYPYLSQSSSIHLSPLSLFHSLIYSVLSPRLCSPSLLISLAGVFRPFLLPFLSLLPLLPFTSPFLSSLISLAFLFYFLPFSLLCFFPFPLI